MHIPGIPVLNYHAIDPEVDNSAPNVSVSLAAFTEQMEWLHRQGYRSVTREDLRQVILNGRGLKDKYVLITFDDGYYSLHKYARGILAGFGFNATLFLSTSFIGQSYEQNDFYFVKHDRQLTWDELKELQQSGWSIQSHGFTHRRMNSLSAEELMHEVTTSKKLIEQNLGTAVDEFAYPYGLYNSMVIRTLKTAGYQFAYSVHSGKLFPGAPRYRLPRIEINNMDSIASFITKVTTGYTSRSNEFRSKLRDIIYANTIVKDVIEKCTPYFGFGNH